LTDLGLQSDRSWRRHCAPGRSHGTATEIHKTTVDPCLICPAAAHLPKSAMSEEPLFFFDAPPVRYIPARMPASFKEPSLRSDELDCFASMLSLPSVWSPTLPRSHAPTLPRSHAPFALGYLAPRKELSLIPLAMTGQPCYCHIPCIDSAMETSIGTRTPAHSAGPGSRARIALVAMQLVRDGLFSSATSTPLP